ncbi:MAG: homoserine kinase [Actinomycetota bacterium]|nr:homoserine kinase [Actinomycetota bacterium]MDQ1643286.1 homoserine kinase [Actinomycetota bacterium]
MSARREVTVVVPATSANLGPGFDALAVALGLYDEVTARVIDGGASTVDVHVEGEGADELPRDGTHLVVRAMHETYAALSMKPPGLALRCVNSIPHGRGLGSSAAAIVAGVVAARALVGDGERLDDQAALALAARIEGHPDNVAACLLGGLTVAWRDSVGAHAVRLDPAPSVDALVFVPTGRLDTETARGMLPAVVPHEDAAHAAGRAALLVEALTRRPELLLAATEDRLHQRYRASAMPGTADLVDRLRSAGVPAFVSGAGPSVLALVISGERPPLASDPGPGWSVVRLPLDAGGARLTSSEG